MAFICVDYDSSAPSVGVFRTTAAREDLNSCDLLVEALSVIYKQFKKYLNGLRINVRCASIPLTNILTYLKLR